MKVGNRVAARRIRSTTPPSWSTPRKSGHFRRTVARQRGVDGPDLVQRTTTLESKAITPPRWRSRTSAHRRGRCPRHSATITWPARSGRRIRPTIRRRAVELGAVRPPALDQARAPPTGVGGTVGVPLAAAGRCCRPARRPRGRPARQSTGVSARSAGRTGAPRLVSATVRASAGVTRVPPGQPVGPTRSSRVRAACRGRQRSLAPESPATQLPRSRVAPARAADSLSDTLAR